MQFQPFTAPSREYLLGTDAVGNSYLLTLIDGALLTAMDVIFAATLALLLGLFVASFSTALANRGGRLLLRVATTFSFATPLIAVLLLFYSVQGDSFLVFPLTCGCLLWGSSALTLQTAISTEWNSDYLRLARSLGITPIRQVVVHLFPNLVVPLRAAWVANWPIILSASVVVGYLGANASTPRLGALLKSGYDVFPSAWWLWLSPTVVVATMFAVVFTLMSGRRRIAGGYENG